VRARNLRDNILIYEPSSILGILSLKDKGSSLNGD
jgi:hypothetical protein